MVLKKRCFTRALSAIEYESSPDKDIPTGLHRDDLLKLVLGFGQQPTSDNSFFPIPVFYPALCFSAGVVSFPFFFIRRAPGLAPLPKLSVPPPPLPM